MTKDASTSLSDTAIGGRYRLSREIGRGGMGVVYRAADDAFERSLAIKILGTAGGERETRFLEEARVTGQLQHPGIPPVHDLGRLEDGRPYFAMKLIEGRTLGDLLRGRTQPGQDRSRYLAIFEQIAQTLAYAHSQGVIHRDLKPANVMVGAFGEVQVMDWGLALAVGAGARSRETAPVDSLDPTDAPTLAQHGDTTPRSEETPPAFAEPSTVAQAQTTVELPGGRPPAETLDFLPSSGSGGSTDERLRLTQEGDVLGTPAYMAPEQARGERDELQPACDVFGLGAVLCQILTGAPPFPGKAIDAVQLSRAGDLSDALRRLAACDADGELLALARECLSPDAAARPRDAGVVAERMGSYLASVAERLQQAELERVAAEARTVEEIKRRRVGLALMVSLLLLVCGVGGAAWYYQYDRARRTAEQELRDTLRRNTIADSVRQAETVRALGQWQSADALLGEAEQRVVAGDPDSLLRLVSDARLDLDFCREAEAIRLQQSSWQNEEFSREFAFGSDGAYAKHLATYFQQRLQREDANWENLSPEDVAALKKLPADVLARLVSTLDEWIAYEDDRPIGAGLRQLVERLAPAPWRDAKVSEDPTKLVKYLDEAPLSDVSPDAIASHMVVLADHEMWEDAIRIARRGLLAHPREFWLHYRLGWLLSGEPLNRDQEAIGHYLAALAIKPDAAAVLNDLGNSLHEIGQAQRAEAAYRRSVEMQPDFAYGYSNLALSLMERQAYDEAEQAARHALELTPDSLAALKVLAEVAESRGQTEQALEYLQQRVTRQPKLAKAAFDFGEFLMRKNRPKDAIPWFQKAVDLDPKYAIGWGMLGVALFQQQKYSEAEQATREVIRLAPDDSKGWSNLGAILMDTDRHREALAPYRRALEIEPGNPVYLAQVGELLRILGEPEQARDYLAEAVRLAPDNQEIAKLAAKLESTSDAAPPSETWQRQLAARPKDAELARELGKRLFEAKRYREAAQALQAAVKRDPENFSGWMMLGAASVHLQQYAEAEAAFRQALSIKETAGARYVLGELLMNTGRRSVAREHLERAVELDDTLADAHFSLGSLLVFAKEFDRAEAEFRRAIALDPKWHYRATFASFLFDRGRFEEAIAEGRQALAEVNSESLASRKLQQLLATCRNMRNGELLLPKVLSGEKQLSGPEYLPYIRLCIKYLRRYGDGVTLVQQALEKEPKLADDRDERLRVRGATAAIAACREDLTADDQQRGKWRAQALDWFQAELQAYRRIDDPPERAAAKELVGQWANDPALANVRDVAPLAELKGSEERAWLEFWAEVEAFLNAE